MSFDRQMCDDVARDTKIPKSEEASVTNICSLAENR